MGWEVAFGEEEEVCYEMWDKEEYKEFVADYKKAKKEVSSSAEMKELGFEKEEIIALLNVQEGE